MTVETLIKMIRKYDVYSCTKMLGSELIFVKVVKKDLLETLRWMDPQQETNAQTCTMNGRWIICIN